MSKQKENLGSINMLMDDINIDSKNVNKHLNDTNNNSFMKFLIKNIKILGIIIFALAIYGFISLILIITKYI